jgi:multicomponent Na+:H+ antiporter subunit E
VKKVIPFLTLFILWLLLTWSLDWQQVSTGIIMALLVSLALQGLYQEKIVRIFNPVRWFWFGVYVLYFLYYCFRANLDVAYRAIHPDIPIRPGIVKVHTDLKTDLAKAFLANSITLTPGTLTVDIQDNKMFIHWINVCTDDPEEQNEIIVKRFERILRRIFE